jgi:K+-sensing histidine kinase KdpD
MSLVCVAIVTALLMLLEQPVAASLVPIAYLVPVVIAATQWGIWPAALASIASTAAADFFFFPPIFSFQVDDPQDAINLLLFLMIALVSSHLASRLRQETERLRRRESDIQNLYDFSRRLAACFTVSDLISAIENYLSRTLGHQAVFFAARTDGRFEPPKSGSVPKVMLDSVASMIATTETPPRNLVDEPTRDFWFLRVVSSETAVLGLVAATNRYRKGHGRCAAASASPAPQRRLSRHAVARIVHAARSYPRVGQCTGCDAFDPEG